MQGKNGIYFIIVTWIKLNCSAPFSSTYTSNVFNLTPTMNLKLRIRQVDFKWDSPQERHFLYLTLVRELWILSAFPDLTFCCTTVRFRFVYWVFCSMTVVVWAVAACTSLCWLDTSFTSVNKIFGLHNNWRWISVLLALGSACLLDVHPGDLQWCIALLVPAVARQSPENSY